MVIFLRDVIHIVTTTSLYIPVMYLFSCDAVRAHVRMFRAIGNVLRGPEGLNKIVKDYNIGNFKSSTLVH